MIYYNKIYSNSIELNDDHRSIIDDEDILENIYQIQTLSKSNYIGYFSFEPFSNTLIKDINIFKIINNSFNNISSNI